jgi:hypothetical protein
MLQNKAVVTLEAAWLSEGQVCFRAVSLTKSDVNMDVKKLICLVSDRQPLRDQTQKEYHNRDLCRRLLGSNIGIG